MLMVLLQRTPVMNRKCWRPQRKLVVASPFGTVLKSAVAVVAALGAVNTMVGATPTWCHRQWAPRQVSPSIWDPTVSIFYTVTGTQNAAGFVDHRWQVLPPGLNFSEANNGGDGQYYIVESFRNANDGGHL